MSLHEKYYKEIVKTDEDFKKEFVSIEGNKFPWFADDIEMGCFCTAHQGWLVGKYGKDKGTEMVEKYKSLVR